MMVGQLEVVVPLRWSGLPYAEGSAPLAWLGVDGLELSAEGPEPPPRAVRLRFRAGFTFRDRGQLERAVDEANGGPENTNDLDVAYTALMASLQVRYEMRLWPEGRPEAKTQEEVTAQGRMIDEALFDDLHRPAEFGEDEESRQARVEAAAFDRVAQQRQLGRDLGEMSVLIEGPTEWKDLVHREWQSVDHIDAVVAAYRHAKAERERTRGKGMRSAA